MMNINVKCYHCSSYVEVDPAGTKACLEGVEGKCRSHRYMTRETEDKLSTKLQMFMWKAIRKMEVKEVDYLQIFRLKSKEDKQIIIHKQEQSPYQKRYELDCKDAITETVYIVKGCLRSTMMLASEY